MVYGFSDLRLNSCSPLPHFLFLERSLGVTWVGLVLSWQVSPYSKTSSVRGLQSDAEQIDEAGPGVGEEAGQIKCQNHPGAGWVSWGHLTHQGSSIWFCSSSLFLGSHQSCDFDQQMINKLVVVVGVEKEQQLCVAEDWPLVWICCCLSGRNKLWGHLSTTFPPTPLSSFWTVLFCCSIMMTKTNIFVQKHWAHPVCTWNTLCWIMR